MTAWNDFVKKIYHEGHNKNPSYSFKQALKDASKRKGEMGKTPSMTSMSSTKKMRSKSSKKGGSSRRKRTRRHRR